MAEGVFVALSDFVVEILGGDDGTGVDGYFDIVHVGGD